MTKPRPIAIDLFSGVGGMSLGIKQAGFDVISAFDFEERHVLAYRNNFPFVSSHKVNLELATGSHIRRLSNYMSGEIDLVFGGPPCQGFSLGGHRRPLDERNFRMLDFVRLVRSLRPKYFILENVQGLLANHSRLIFEQLLRRVRLAGYDIAEEIRTLDASDYGVPQRRKRVFILGYRKGCEPITYPDKNPLLDEIGNPYCPVVVDAIDDLPTVDMYEHLLFEDGFFGELGNPSHYAKLMRCLIRDPCDKFYPRQKRSKALTGCLRTRHNADVVERFRNTRPGTMEPISRFFRLNAQDVARTIRAGTGVDRGKHTAPRPIHHKYPRCITVREAARLHSFPDWFQFDSTRWHAFRQIGNAVPPRLARSVGQVVFEKLQS